MSDFVGVADAVGLAGISPSVDSSSQVSSGQTAAFSAPSSEPRISQPLSQGGGPESDQLPRNPQGQFVSPQSGQPSGQLGGQQPGSFLNPNATQPSAFGQQPGILAAFKAAGYDTGAFRDDTSFLNAINERLVAAEQSQQQIAEYQRQLAAREQAIPQRAAMPPQALERVQEHLATPVEQQPGWNPPAYDPQYDKLFRFDEQLGRWVPNQPNVPYELVQAKNEYMDYKSAFAKEFASNPVDAIWNRSEAKNRALIREELKTLFDQMQVTKETNDWIETNKSVLFVDGQVDHTGDVNKLTEAGKLALKATEELDRAGVQDPAARRLLTEKFIAAELSQKYLAQQNDPRNRRYTIDEITQAIRAAQGLPPESGPGVSGDGQGAPQAPPQQVPMQPMPGAFAGQPAPMMATMPQQFVVQPGAQTPQAWSPVPSGYQATMPYTQQPAQYGQQFQQPQAGFVPQVPQQAYGQQQMPMTPEQVDAMNKRRFVGGVGHSSSAGPSAASPNEFVPQPSSNGKPNFLAIANQLAAARGQTL